MTKPSPAQALAAKKKPRKPTNSRKTPWICTVGDERRSLELSQDDVCRAVGLTKSALSVIEQGTDPKLTTAAKLSAFFCLPIEQLWTQRPRKGQP